ncbi:hypothetical protein F5876DRAFT_71009 [Lentinula aff. lateritia]|uniref:Uncharacterized protein n=1 Tax=Lentinula aff. lateritia TaxID=2804960 RepID=A0ACC1THF1_9AGAR|nr:hypothetical protein F5876DRAFT_71009 [Lentinula aff. lateritia]
MSPPEVVWNGYQLDRRSFKKFVMVLTGRRDGPSSDDDQFSVKWASQYTVWRFKLPPRDSYNAENLFLSLTTVLVLYLNPDSPDDITHLFFPIHWIPYKSSRQLDDPTHTDYATTHGPNEKDKAKLDRWLTYIHENNGDKYRFSADIFEFTAIKDLHPAYEWRILRAESRSQQIPVLKAPKATCSGCFHCWEVLSTAFRPLAENTGFADELLQF